MKVTFTPAHLRGSVWLPPSKSDSHRLLLAAALAGGESILTGLSDADDILATRDCLGALGACITETVDGVRVVGGIRGTDRPLDCRASGSTLRFLLPVALTLGEKVTFVGEKRLFERPLGAFERLCAECGFAFEKGEASLTVKGKLTAGAYSVPGNESSQFASGMLFALASLAGESRLTIVEPIVSEGYIGMTADVLRRFGADIGREGNCFRIRGGLSARNAEAERDASGGVFFEALRALGEDITVLGLPEKTLQPDARYPAYIGALEKGDPTLSLVGCPDLAPMLFALAGALHGATFEGTARLKGKESDRVDSMREELRKMGIMLEELGDSVRVSGALHAPTGLLFSHSDHRVVMALSVLLSLVGGSIEDASCVRKSMPDFYEKLRTLGARFSVTEAF